MDTVATMSKVIGETRRVVDNIEPGQLSNPSPCDGWTVRDVLNHVTGGATMFALCVRDGSVPDEKLGEIMGGDNLGDDYKRSFNEAADLAESSFSLPGAMDKIVKLPFGEMPAGTALDIAVFDVTVHTWDLAKATGQSTALDPEVLDAAYGIGQQFVTDDFRAAGIFGAEVAVAADAPMQDRLAGLAGRAP